MIASSRFSVVGLSAMADRTHSRSVGPTPAASGTIQLSELPAFLLSMSIWRLPSILRVDSFCMPDLAHCLADRFMAQNRTQLLTHKGKHAKQRYPVQRAACRNLTSVRFRDCVRALKQCVVADLNGHSATASFLACGRITVPWFTDMV